MRFYDTTPIKTQQNPSCLHERHKNKLKIILIFTVNPRAAWATFKKQKGEGDSVKPYKKNTSCTTIKLLQLLQTAGKSTSKLQNPVERTEQDRLSSGHKDYEDR